MAICCLLYVIASHDATYIYTCMPYITDINNFMKTKMGNKKKNWNRISYEHYLFVWHSDYHIFLSLNHLIFVSYCYRLLLITILKVSDIIFSQERFSKDFKKWPRLAAFTHCRGIHHVACTYIFEILYLIVVRIY